MLCRCARAVFRCVSRRRCSRAVPLTFAVFWAFIAVIAFRDATNGPMLISPKQLTLASFQTTEPIYLWEMIPNFGLSKSRLDKDLMLIRNCSLSTEQIHRVPDHHSPFFGKYHSIRKQLDYTYHSFYSIARQQLQDSILDEILRQPNNFIDAHGHHCRRPKQPWIVLTAGAMGAGKSHTVRELGKQGLFPLKAFAVVDPDHIRRKLPEFNLYIQRCPNKAGQQTRKEAGMIAEIAVEASLQQGYNVLIDGSLSNATWYENYFAVLRSKYPTARIAILHVTAPREIVLERAASRARETRRVVPSDLLEQTMKVVPQSVARLRPQVDFCVEILNVGERQSIVSDDENMTWDVFRENWKQECGL